MSDDGIDWSADDDPIDEDIPEVPDVETDDGSDDDGIDTERAKEIGEQGLKTGKEAGKEAGKAASAAAKAGGAAAGMMLKAAKLIPYQSRLYRKLAIRGLKGYYKRSDADAIGIEKRPNGALDFVPITYLASEVTDEGQRPGWQVHGRDRSYDAASMGDSVAYLNDTPVVPLHSDATVESTWMAPRIAEAVELDQYWPIFNGAEINPIFEVPQGIGENPDQTTYADGGQLEMREQFRGFEVSDPGHYAGDSIVDLSSGESHDGMRISFSKAQDILDERTTSERMDMQEQRGRIMSQLQGGKEAYAMKMLLIAAAAIVLSIAAVTILPEMLSSGGGGGGFNPLLALPTGL